MKTITITLLGDYYTIVGPDKSWTLEHTDLGWLLIGDAGPLNVTVLPEGDIDWQAVMTVVKEGVVAHNP